MEAEQRMQSGIGQRLLQQQVEDERQMKLEYQGNESFNDDDNYGIINHQTCSQSVDI